MEFVDGKVENFDAIILATGYRSNVPDWLMVSSYFTFYLSIVVFSRKLTFKHFQIGP